MISVTNVTCGTSVSSVANVTNVTSADPQGEAWHISRSFYVRALQNYRLLYAVVDINE